jgi:K+-transporting ATPase KdpF subunit
MSVSAKNSNKKIMENVVVGAVALLLFIYLMVAMLRPEKF